jgi:hypothetical protein
MIVQLEHRGHTIEIDIGDGSPEALAEALDRETAEMVTEMANDMGICDPEIIADLVVKAQATARAIGGLR